jgi:hypothetical protein
LQAGSQAERFPFPDRDDQAPVPGYLIQHHAVERLRSQRRSEPGDFGDAHLDEADIGSRRHGSFPSLAASTMLRLTATVTAAPAPGGAELYRWLPVVMRVHQRRPGDGSCGGVAA